MAHAHIHSHTHACVHAHAHAIYTVAFLYESHLMAIDQFCQVDYKDTRGLLTTPERKKSNLNSSSWWLLLPDSTRCQVLLSSMRSSRLLITCYAYSCAHQACPRSTGYAFNS